MHTYASLLFKLRVHYGRGGNRKERVMEANRNWNTDPGAAKRKLRLMEKITVNVMPRSQWKNFGAKAASTGSTVAKQRRTT